MSSNKAHHVCYCHACKREIRSLGISAHRRAHLNRGDVVTITYSGGETKTHGRRAAETGNNPTPDRRDNRVEP